jgi:hypothetical protein
MDGHGQPRTVSAVQSVRRGRSHRHDRSLTRKRSDRLVACQLATSLERLVFSGRRRFGEVALRPNQLAYFVALLELPAWDSLTSRNT